MALTNSQLNSYKAAINAEVNATLVALRNAQDYQGMADWYNDVASPAVPLWRPRISSEEIQDSVVWSDFAARTQGQRDIWFSLMSGGFINATRGNVRTGFAQAFGAGSQTVTNLSALAQVNATRFESVFAADTSPSSAAKVTSVFGYRVSAADVREALVIQ